MTSDNGQTTLNGSETGAPVTTTWIPLLTILAHPQAARIGDVAWMPDLMAPERPVEVCRSQPLFSGVDGEREAPLSSPLISRRPVVIHRGLAGTWTLDPGELAGKVFVDGLPLTSKLTVDCERLDSGVVVRVGRHVVVQWHRAPRAAAGASLGLVGHSPAIEALRGQLRRLATMPGSVLVRGETGTGKELVAAALHDVSGRDGPFVAVNLGAVPTSLASAELFGHAKGAFTGANGARDGYFVQASGGTLLLDEIGDAPDEVQLALLRVLETGQVRPVGATRPRSVDARLVAATDAALETRIREGSFRAALYHRLATHVIDVPPLRERRSDIGRLLVHFLRKDLGEMGEASLLDSDSRDKRVWLSAKVVERLTLDGWPGNVRQLRNVARYLAGRANETGPLRADDPGLLRHLTALDPVPDARPPALPSAERRRPREIGNDELKKTLEERDWQLGRAAEHFGISRVALNGLVDEHPELRRAKFLTEEEIEAARPRARESGEPLWKTLRVSKRGLARRLASIDRALNRGG